MGARNSIEKPSPTKQHLHISTPNTAAHAAAATKNSEVPSLAKQVEQKVFEVLAKHVQKEAKQSVFAVGGPIPPTSLDDHLICESDDAGPGGGHETSRGASEEPITDQEVIVTDANDNEEDQPQAPSPKSLLQTTADEEEDTCYSDISNRWTDDFSIKQVKWLNKPSHDEMALVHGTYGNEAGLGYKHASSVITMDIRRLKIVRLPLVAVREKDGVTVSQTR
ncbi:uncharacterized protein Z520_08723 [Fonsecaea multimorphosa CBS 102226]|uniref:Uncharacterized protein n=1 Tax=Fonsecaea multimorphosa CBS 102226 TaxID=1442371 RepID=A0A0D2KG02_9EURO|nr:uncharacterized protein Z520_08723 [Fonsecaea multimorphosa CBS 102226]KIX95603.1 hypothetical protein Z520_08723 [Fonsecaea multimorphosa CBS 102226]OAL21208.1 hypothetical protein AYO22_08171 [Fonsecaea multimorphosa]